jgi:hypothetical protein
MDHSSAAYTARLQDELQLPRQIALTGSVQVVRVRDGLLRRRGKDGLRTRKLPESSPDHSPAVRLQITPRNRSFIIPKLFPFFNPYFCRIRRFPRNSSVKPSGFPMERCSARPLRRPWEVLAGHIQAQAGGLNKEKPPIDRMTTCGRLAHSEYKIKDWGKYTK